MSKTMSMITLIMPSLGAWIAMIRIWTGIFNEQNKCEYVLVFRRPEKINKRKKENGVNESYELIFSSKDVSKNLNIATSTLRTWCLKLEAAGYLFSRTDDNRRMFFDRDIKALRELQDLLAKKLPIDTAIEQVSSKYREMTHSVTKENASSKSSETMEKSVTLASPERPLDVSSFIQEIRTVMREEVHQEIAASFEEQTKRLDKDRQELNEKLLEINELLQKIEEDNKKSWLKKMFGSKK